jgi:hypothetical protein
LERVFYAPAATRTRLYDLLGLFWTTV